MKAGGRPYHVAVVGGGLAGMAAALECADAGLQVTLLERRARLGGLTWSFRHDGRWIDNGQHVFLHCCHEYLSFLERIGASGDVYTPGRLDVPVVAPAAQPGGHPRIGRIRRSSMPAPLHLVASLARYRHLAPRERARLGQAALGLRRLDLSDPALDNESFGAWLARHGQKPDAIERLWDLICIPTVNLPAAEASLAMAAKVFQTGLLTSRLAGDIGWSRVPLARLHGGRASLALARAGVEVRLGAAVVGIEPGWTVRFTRGELEADAVVLAVPHTVAPDLLPPGSLPLQDRLADLGTSAIVDVHLLFDRPVTAWPMFAGVCSPVQFVFDRTESSGLEPGPASPQYLAVSLSAADALLSRHPGDLISSTRAELTRLLPEASTARLLDGLVTKERAATFRAAPGTARLRPQPRTAHRALAVAGAWTDTGWPATMEGAVRSGRHAASVILQELSGYPIQEAA
jgi:squalene-associated FAD-dependent desaturase